VLSEDGLTDAVEGRPERFAEIRQLNKNSAGEWNRRGGIVLQLCGMHCECGHDYENGDHLRQCGRFESSVVEEGQGERTLDRS